MDGDGDMVGGSGGGRELVVYVSWGGEFDDGGGTKVTYVGGWTKCFVMKEDMGMEEVRRTVREITGDDLNVRKLWYSLKYDRGMVMEMEGDGDGRMFVKGNEEHGYMYVGSREGPKSCAQNARGSCDNGVVCGRRRKGVEEKVGEGGKGGCRKRCIALNAAVSDILKFARVQRVRMAGAEKGVLRQKRPSPFVPNVAEGATSCVYMYVFEYVHVRTSVYLCMSMYVYCGVRCQLPCT